MSIHIASYQSPVGQLQIRCSDEFVQGVFFLNEDVNTVNSDHPIVQNCLLQLDEYFAGQRRVFDLPLHQTGTAFQQKIWELLLQIDYGKTISYNHLAKQYGDVKAIRAVATANGKNNLPIIVPCHRVIGSNHSLTGYSGGLWRKQWLLEHEAKHFGRVQLLFGST